ncbi:30S ribosomal protein S27e [Candidatus Anstonella stagnisolia]|nr:30S ribosomal protein S27e [Candidatus Anstonella stagnisolia]
MSKFLKVKCACGNEQNIFSNASLPVSCLVCNTQLTQSSGSRVRVLEGKAKVLEVL